MPEIEEPAPMPEAEPTPEPEIAPAEPEAALAPEPEAPSRTTFGSTTGFDDPELAAMLFAVAGEIDDYEQTIRPDSPQTPVSPAPEAAAQDASKAAEARSPVSETTENAAVSPISEVDSEAADPDIRKVSTNELNVIRDTLEQMTTMLESGNTEDLAEGLKILESMIEQMI